MPKIVTPVIRHLDDEYERDQLVPTYLNPLKGKDFIPENVHDAIEDLPDSANNPAEYVLDKTPEVTQMILRQSCMEAIVNAEIDSMIDEAAERGEEVDAGEIEDHIGEIADDAVVQHLVPNSFRKTALNLVHKRLRYSVADPQYSLLKDAAMIASGRLAYMSDDDAVVSEDNLETPIESDGQAEEVVSDEMVEPTDAETVDVDETVPQPMARLVRYSASSLVNSRKSLALMSRHVTGGVLQQTLHSIRPSLSMRLRNRLRLR